MRWRGSVGRIPGEQSPPWPAVRGTRAQFGGKVQPVVPGAGEDARCPRELIPRVGFVVFGSDFFHVQLRVDLRRSDAFVAQEFLDGAEVGAALQ